MSLRPDETVQKILLSSTCAFVAEYETKAVLVTHAWPNFHDRAFSFRRAEGPNSRSGYVVCFRTAPIIKAPGVPVPDFGSCGEVLAADFALLFGKRFDNHGGTETTGFFHIPEMSSFSHTCSPTLPQNSHKPRANFAIGLDLREISRIEPLINWSGENERFYNAFRTATKFYYQALKNAELDYEVAYLNLITAGEVLSNAFDYDKDSLLDDQIILALSKLEESIQDGAKIVRMVKGRLLQVKKRFVRTICDLIDDDFFLHSDVDDEWKALKKDSFEKAVSSAYDLRSKYVHTGVAFGGWIRPLGPGLVTEVQVGTPVVNDKEFEKILTAAPTYVGLERIIRYCLLKYGEMNGAVNLYPRPSEEAGITAA